MAGSTYIVAGNGWRYRVIDWSGGYERKPCPLKRKNHEPHGYILASDLLLYDCEGLPPPAPNCKYNEYSNRQCLEDEGHDGDHHIPCVESSAHKAHTTGGVDGHHTPYICNGQSFDRT